MSRSPATGALLALLLAVPLDAAGPRFWRLEGARAFLEGDLEGLALDSQGRLRLGPAPRLLHDTGAPNGWSVARDAKGVLYVGTGNDGRVLRVEGERGSVLFDADEPEVHAVAVSPDGRVYAGTSPDGAVYAIDAAGRATRVFDPAETYVWSLAFDPKGALLVATGGEGRVYRVGADGRAEMLLETTETHVLSLALDERGRVFAGTAPEGIVFRIDAPGKAFALHDSAFREVKALAVGTDGSVYAAVVDGRTTETAARATTAPTPAAAPSGAVVAEVTVSESFAVAPVAAAAAPSSAATDAQPAGPPKGALLRLRPTGEVDTLWSSPDDVPHAAAITDAGLLVGTGNKGKVYRVGADGRWALVATLPAEQVTALAPAAEGAVLVTSNPSRVHALDATVSRRGSFVSRPRDTEVVSSWGRLAWEGEAPAGTEVRLETRAGNTATPDATWSPWSAPIAGGEAIRSERARFLQLRLTLAGKDGASPRVDAVSAAYLQRNLPPVVRAITVHPSGEVFQKPISVTGEPEILGLDVDPLSDRAAAARPAAGTPPAVSFSRKMTQRGLRTFSWQAEDPNGDPLLFDVSYRGAGDDRWFPLREDLAEAVYTWDTATVPNGRYVLRVSAKDGPGNPPALALSASEESPSFEVDNSSPAIAAALDPARPGHVRAVVRDDGSPVRRLEISVDGGRWQEVHPKDGIADSLEETYDIVLPAAGRAGRRTVVLRASDLLGNASTARVDVP
jgi:sugar lactone lactonase YvrE